MTETRFDIIYAISTVSQFASNPTLEHVAAVKQIFNYLKKYLSLRITFNQDKPFKLKEHINCN